MKPTHLYANQRISIQDTQFETITSPALGAQVFLKSNLLQTVRLEKRQQRMEGCKAV